MSGSTSHCSSSGQSESDLPIVSPLGNVVKPPQKRAETWGLDEIKALISLRVGMDSDFVPSSSNRELWDQISVIMVDMGFRRTSNMCADKWRALVKQHRKAKRAIEADASHGLFGRKYRTYKELDAVVIDVAESEASKRKKRKRALSPPKLAGSVPSRSAQSQPSLSLQAPVATFHSFVLQHGNKVQMIRLDADESQIKESVRCCFGIRGNRRFWLEDDKGTVWPISKSIPDSIHLTLVLDPGVMIRVCEYGEILQGSEQAESYTFYTDQEFRTFLHRRAWLGLTDMAQNLEISNLGDLVPNELYLGGRACLSSKP